MRNFFENITNKYNRDTTLNLKQYCTLNGKLARKTEHLKFLLQCKSYGIIPKHIRNKNKTASMFTSKQTIREAEKIEHFFHTRILKLEIKEVNIRIQELKKSMQYTETTIKSILDKKESTKFFNKQSNSHNIIKEKKRQIHKQKIEKLKGELIQQFGFIINEDWFVNKTDIEFPEESVWLLSLGKKFAIPIHNKNFSPIKIVADVEQAIQTLQEEKDKEIARTTLCNRIQRYKNRLHHTTKEKFILKVYKNTMTFIRQT